MIGEKVQQFQGKSTDLSELQGKIESYLKSEGFTVSNVAAGTAGHRDSGEKGWVSE